MLFFSKFSIKFIMNQYLLKGILFDFNGVLSNDYFFSCLQDTDSTLYKSINKYIFKTRPKLINNWMRGKITSDKINRIIAKKFNKPYSFIKKSLEDSVRDIKLNQKILGLVDKFHRDGIKTAVLTDNMDIFTNILVPHKKLYNFFDKIFSSNEYGKLKEDNSGEFIKEALKSMELNPKNTILVDDSKNTGVLYKKLGGHFFHYKNNYEEFKMWLNNFFIF